MYLPAFSNTMRRWKEITVCCDPGCRYSHALVRRLSHGGGSIQIRGKRYCFPHWFDRALLGKLHDLPARLNPTPSHGHRVPLGLLMLSRGELGAAQLQKALQAQRQSGTGYIGEWLLRLGFAHEEQITSALAAQWSCAMLRAFPQFPQTSRVPFPLLQAFGMAPACFIEATKTIYIAFAGRIEYHALLAVQDALQCKAIPCMTSSSALESALRRMRDTSARADHHFENVRSLDEMARIISSYAEKLDAENVQLTAVGGFVWCRIEASDNSASLLFPRAGSEMMAAAIPRQPAISPELALSASAGR